MRQGFTVMEMLITVSVLAVLLTFAAPGFSNLMKSSRMNSVQDVLSGFFIMGRSEAVLRNMPVNIHFHELSNVNPSERCLVISLSDTNSDCRGLKPNGTKTYYKDFLPMSMGALNAITMKIKMQYYKRSYWNILFRTKMKDARKNLIR
ncbi:prepilin-type N-terminal cleavage/methylation domain-containing protein [Vibrio sp. 2175-1]|jgi:prepilin-type N-terminal cleavage/methylation domain-containing protein|nr:MULTISPECIES: prepilin-type N-terminal cleavage/methylation domain-containing protein [Vibrio]MCA2494177.1 prepilin-type N-terminal cleavage/methylation domain-containing protein [Vibrio alginolyticus]MDW2221139.1 prepilin-type N-terminal cleavage/methylation domain-containing protein [Vibrio sp. 2175-1]